MKMGEQMFVKLSESEYYLMSFIRYVAKNCHHGRKLLIANLSNIISLRADDDAILAKIAIYMRGFAKNHKNYRAHDRLIHVRALLGAKSVRKYLDYGCGNGTITQQIGSYLKLSRAQTFGLDIIKVNNDNITVMDIANINKYMSSFDLVTAFVSLHHMENVEADLSIISKILKPGGLFIIREHDFDPQNEHLRAYLDLIHKWCAFVAPTSNSLNHACNYKSKKDWDTVIIAAGFRFLKERSYDGNNPQRLYYASYVRV